MKFNFLSKEKTTIVNHEKAKAFPLTAEYELYTAVVTTSLSASFYEKEDTRLERIKTLIY